MFFSENFTLFSPMFCPLLTCPIVPCFHPGCKSSSIQKVSLHRCPLSPAPALMEATSYYKTQSIAYLRSKVHAHTSLERSPIDPKGHQFNSACPLLAKYQSTGKGATNNRPRITVRAHTSLRAKCFS